MITPTFYTPRAYVDTTPDAELSVLRELCEQPHIDYDFMVELVDRFGSSLQDVTAYAVRPGAQVVRDSTTEQNATLTLDFQSTLVWGADLLKVSVLISSRTYNGGVAYRFPYGVYVATVAPKDLQSTEPFYHLTGYDKNYLLQNQLADTYTVTAGDHYIDHVQGLLTLAGAMQSGDLLTSFVTYPVDWSNKQVPVGADAVYPLGDSSNYTHIQIINELLEASGCRPIYTDRTGRFVIEDTPDTTKQQPGWIFAGGVTGYTPAGWPYNSVVLDAGRSGGLDVWNAPNSFKYIQRGLTYNPAPGNGEYVWDDLANQNLLNGRKITVVKTLDASSQQDLETQAKADILAIRSQSSKLAITTALWPMGWHYDIFYYTDDKLPINTPVLRAQTQQITTDLDAGTTTWAANVVPAS